MKENRDEDINKLKKRVRTEEEIKKEKVNKI